MTLVGSEPLPQMSPIIQSLKSDALSTRLWRLRYTLLTCIAYLSVTHELTGRSLSLSTISREIIDRKLSRQNQNFVLIVRKFNTRIIKVTFRVYKQS